VDRGSKAADEDEVDASRDEAPQQALEIRGGQVRAFLPDSRRVTMSRTKS